MTPSPFKQAVESFYDISKPIQTEKTPEKKDQYVNDFSQVYSPFNIASQIQSGETTEDIYNESVRDVTRTGSRMVETILGLPGNVHQFGKKLRENVPNVTNIPPFSYVQQGLNKAFDLLPTQESLQQLSENISGGYTKPRSEGESFSDEIFKTFAPMVLAPENLQQYSSLPPKIRSGVNLLRKLGTSVAGEYGKEGAKSLGAGGVGQEAAKQGLMFIMGMGLPRLTGERSPDNFISNIYAKRDALIPPGTMVTPSGLESRLQNYINSTLKYGGPTPEKKHVASIAEEFLQKISGRAIEMKELLQMFRDVNRNRSSAMAIQNLDKPGVKQARKYWGDISRIFNDSIEGYIAPISQDALKYHKDANSAFSTLIKSRRTTDYIMDKAKNVPLQTGIGALFGGSIALNPLLAAKGLAVAGAGAATVGTLTKTGEMAYRFIMNPALRHYYEEVLVNALRENGPATIRALKKLDDRYLIELKDPKSNVNQALPTSQIQK